MGEVYESSSGDGKSLRMIIRCRLYHSAESIVGAEVVDTVAAGKGTARTAAELVLVSRSDRFFH